MVKPIKFRAENNREHYRLLLLIHSFAQHHPASLREITYKGRERESPMIRKSCYFFHNPPTAILHLINIVVPESNYVEIYGNKRKNIYRAARKIEGIGHVKLTKLEESIQY